MELVPTSAPKAAATRHPRRILLAVAALCAAALTLAWSVQRTGSVVAADAVAPVAHPAPAPADARPSPPSDRGHGSRFFGFLEFDWDPDAPGGVPGFDPWPRP
jgi:hypothetical protein